MYLNAFIVARLIFPEGMPHDFVPVRILVPRGLRRSLAFVLSISVVLVVAVVATALVRMMGRSTVAKPPLTGGAPFIGEFSHHHVVITLPPHSYLGAFVKGVPESYAPMETFAKATGEHPNVALYYSGWYEKFRTAFAVQAKRNGTIPFIQIRSYSCGLQGSCRWRVRHLSENVRCRCGELRRDDRAGSHYRLRSRDEWFLVLLGTSSHFPGLLTPPRRHIVNVFRQQGAYDVTWLWTVNIIDKRNDIPSPARWWPGSSYVTWIGIDGYFLKSSWKFALCSGQPSRSCARLHSTRYLSPRRARRQQPTNQPRSRVSLQAPGLTGCWDSYGSTPRGSRDWRLRGAPSFSAFQRGAKTFDRPAS